MGWILAVHIGAGRYGESAASEAKYLELLRSALRHGESLIQHHSDSGDSSVTRAAMVATSVLSIFEKNDLTNCGRGSNLTEAGVVECEASVACGATRSVTACAGVSGVAVPSSLAAALLSNALRPDLSADGVGREPPLVLVGDQARAFARRVGIDTSEENASDLREYQVTEDGRRVWRHWRNRCTVGEDEGASSSSSSSPSQEARMDTVGAICVDPEGNTAAALSSGGVLFKVPGRVGLAGCPRMGCDARNPVAASYRRKAPSHNNAATAFNGFAIVCTGRGEQFIRTGFVHDVGQRLRTAAHIEQALRSSFEESKTVGQVPLEGGAMALMVPAPDDRRKSKRRKQQEDGTGLIDSTCAAQLGVAFTTRCMGVGYITAASSTPHVQILRQPLQHEEHLVVHVSALDL